MDPRKKDHYRDKAKKEGYLARSVFKLQELDAKYKIIRQGQRVLDLGAAPGSWMQYVVAKVGPQGLAVGIDLNPLRVSPSPQVICIEADILVFPFADLVREHGLFHAVVSDVAPQTSGQHDRDHEASLELCEMALTAARQTLKPGGHFVCKMYQGEHTKAFLDRLKASFDLAKIQKPEASRAESKEVFFVGLGFKKS